MVFFLSACAVTPSPTAAPPLDVTATPTSALNPGATLQPLPTTAPPAQQLRLWLPPQFAPSPDTAGGEVLLAELSAFEEVHPGWQIDARIKTVTGEGGLINSLQTTLRAAPNLGPDVIALDSPMLMEAAPVVQPLDTTLAADDLADFYPFALQAARVNNQLDGLPFAADALGLAYSTTAYAVPPQTWIDLHDVGPLWLPLADPAALVTLQQYLALGGALTDTAGQPSIDESLLAEVLAHYQVMQIAGSLPAASFSVSDSSQTWTTFRENRAVAASAFAGQYLADRTRVTATAFTLLPTRDGNRLTFASQWNFALVTTDPARQAVALDLMRWLTAPDNLGAWTSAAGVLPTRSGALAAWSDPATKALAGEALAAAVPMPSPEVLAVISPPVTAAVQAVLKGQATPEEAAKRAAEAIKQK